MDYIRECDIVFLDINMDDMDGLEAAGQIKAECMKVHIVLVTAYVNYALDGILCGFLSGGLEIVHFPFRTELFAAIFDRPFFNAE